MTPPTPSPGRIAPDAAVNAAVGNLIVAAIAVVTAIGQVLIGLSGYLGPCADSVRTAHLPRGAGLLVGAGVWGVAGLGALDAGRLWRWCVGATIPAGIGCVALVWWTIESESYRYAMTAATGVVAVMSVGAVVRGSGRGGA